MATTLTARLTSAFSASYATDSALAPLSYAPPISFTKSIANGTADGKADRLYTAERTIAASGTDSLDLAGSLLDVFGQAFTPAEVVALVIKAADGNTNNVVVGGDTNAFVGPFGDKTDKISIPPGGMVILPAPPAGWPVTPTTGDILKLANSGAGTGVTYQIAILGRSV